MKIEEKIILLGALFHDIGKFQQRITNEKIPHAQLGSILLDDAKELFIRILDDSEEAFNKVKSLVVDHHNRDKNYNLLNLLKISDHLSASERVEFDDEDNWQQKWSHKYLTSLFSKIFIADNDNNSRNTRYYNHKPLDKKDYKILIPSYETEKDLKDDNVGYPPETFKDFKKDLTTVLTFYKYY